MDTKKEYDFILRIDKQNQELAALRAKNAELLAALECLHYTVDGLVTDKSRTVKDALNIARAAIIKAKGE